MEGAVPPSTAAVERLGSAFESSPFRKNELIFLSVVAGEVAVAFGLNVNGRRAKASWPVNGGRGGSMGINFSPAWNLQFSLRNPGRWTVTLM